MMWEGVGFKWLYEDEEKWQICPEGKIIEASKSLEDSIQDWSF